MNILNASYFKLSNTIFCYSLTPIQLSVYGYLVSCAGQKGKCWPSMRTIAAACGCSKNAARAAADELGRRGFLRKTATYREERDGRNRQTNNTYYILDLPNLPPKPGPVYREGTLTGGEMNEQNEEQQIKPPREAAVRPVRTQRQTGRSESHLTG